MASSIILEHSFFIIDPNSGNCYGELKGANAALVAGYINAITSRLPRGEMFRGYRVGNETISLGLIVVGFGRKLYVATTGLIFKHLPVNLIEGILNTGKFLSATLEFLKTGDTANFPKDTLTLLSKLRASVDLPQQTKIDLTKATQNQLDILASMKNLQENDAGKGSPSLEYFTESESGILTRVTVTREDLNKKLLKRE